MPFYNLVYIESKANINIDSYKLLMMNQGKAYGAKAVEEEIISTAKIESIDYNRDSVRSILKGYAPKDDEETRIFGIKKGFDFIADKNNIITEENIYKLYMMTVGDFLMKRANCLRVTVIVTTACIFKTLQARLRIWELTVIICRMQ